MMRLIHSVRTVRLDIQMTMIELVRLLCHWSVYLLSIDIWMGEWSGASILAVFFHQFDFLSLLQLWFPIMSSCRWSSIHFLCRLISSSYNEGSGSISGYLNSGWVTSPKMCSFFQVVFRSFSGIIYALMDCFVPGRVFYLAGRKSEENLKKCILEPKRHISRYIGKVALKKQLRAPKGYDDPIQRSYIALMWNGHNISNIIKSDNWHGHDNSEAERRKRYRSWPPW